MQVKATIFGGTGDLTNRKLMPAFYNLYVRGDLSEGSEILAVGRRAYTDEQYREIIRGWILKFARLGKDGAALDGFLKLVRYFRMAQYALDEMMYGGRCVICHSDCLEDAKRVRDRIEARFPLQKGRVQIRDIGTAIGSHTGPGTVALFFLGTSRSSNCPFAVPAMPAGNCE